MYVADQIARTLADALRGSDEISTPEEWIWASPQVPADAFADARIAVHFTDAPNAAALATSIAEVDRQARRTVAALVRAVPPQTLFGRGTRLVPPADGLIVERASPGSLDIEMLLGGLYTAVVSAPISFALNLASLLHYGHLIFRRVLPSGETDEIQTGVAPTVRPERAGLMPPPGTVVVPTPHGPVWVPEAFHHVRLSLTAKDGSRLEFEARADTPRADGRR